MKTLAQLSISPAPWKYKQDSGYDRESGDFNTYDAVCDAEGKVMVEWANGESYGEVWPNSEQDASLIAAAPELYEALRMYQEAFEEIRKSAWFLDANFHEMMNLNKVMTAADAALAKAAGESEVK